jgi:RNA polymerase sigma-70 factor (ECF subfamily)
MGMERARPGSTDELLRHQEFVRRLAFELVRDAARADDLVQDAWVQALERPPRAMATARAWFRTVLRNLAVRGAREQSRRERREHAAARAEAQPSPLDIGERRAHEQELVRAVEALREPYRSAVFLRWFEDLSPRAIAAREGVPVATVKTRLRRALELLREALERSQGPRAWALALVRLARPEPVAAPLAVPAVVAAIVLGGGAIWLLGGERRELGEPEVLAALGRTTPVDPVTSVSELSSPVMAEATPRVTVVEAETQPARSAAQTQESAPAPHAEEDHPPIVLPGRVLFSDGNGAAGARVVLGRYTAQADSSGRFALEIDSNPPELRERTPYGGSPADLEGDAPLVAFLDGWVPSLLADVGARVWRAREEKSVDLEPVDLVLGGPALEIHGTVLDRTRVPAEGWRLELLDGTPASRDRYRPFSLEEIASGARTHVATGSDGRFSFRGLTPGKNYRVRAWNEHTLEQIASEPIAAGTEDAVLHAAIDGWRPVVDGELVALDGSPLAGVRCRLSMTEYRREGATWMTTGQEATTDAQGRFLFTDVPPAEIFIRFNGAGVGGRFDLPPDESCRNLRIELVGNGEVFFEAVDRARAPDALCVLDEAGERLRFEVNVAGGSKGLQELPLSSSGTASARVSQLARWLVLLDDGREIERLPLQVRHGEEVRIRW